MIPGVGNNREARLGRLGKLAFIQWLVGVVVILCLLGFLLSQGLRS